MESIPETKNKSNFKLYLGLAALAAIFVAGVATMVVRAYKATVEKKPVPQEQQIKSEDAKESETKKVDCNLKIDSGDESSVATVSANIKADNNVLDCLQRASAAQGFEVVVKNSSFGTLVQKIGDKENDSQNFWMFYVSGELGQVSADKAEIKDGDMVEWRYERIK